MTHEQFDAMVFRLEALARRNPSGYRTRVLLLAFLGNAYLAFILLLSVALFLGLVASILVLKALALKLIAVVGVFLWIMMRALWVKIPPPEGAEIREPDAPELFAMIGDVRRQLGAPPFHRVLVTADFNAGVAQAPRLGVFGWHCNYLLLGLPLMKALTVGQFRAVLAHEFGHLASGHGRMSNWIYRQRLRWSRLISALEQTESRGGFLFRPFLNWYAPYFSAWSFPLARANEYEADATSVRLASPRLAAEALTGVSVIGSYFEERYWPQIHKQADALPHPAFAPYAAMGERVATELDPASTRGWLEKALARSTTSEDTHPALTERLRAIGEAPALSPPEPGQAADRLLSAVLGRITENLDRRWQADILPAWSQRHRQVQEGRHRLSELDTRHSDNGPLTIEDALERANLTESIACDPKAALEQFQALFGREPGNAAVCFSLGVRLLARDDGNGCELVERAIGMEEDAFLAGAEALRDYCWRNGNREQAHLWHRRAIERSELQRAARAERSRLLTTDRFERHGLEDKALEGLRAQLRAVPGLRKAYFVRKRVKHLVHRPCYVFGFTVARAFSFQNKRRAAEVLERIRTGVTFPGETTILNVEGANYPFGRKLRWMRGSRIL